MSYRLTRPDSGVARWWERYPARWQEEEAAMDAAGLGWEPGLAGASHAQRSGALLIPAGSPFTAGSPVAEAAVRLGVLFPDAYPWFPPVVIDTCGDLAWLTRHRNTDGRLCLIHDRDWHVDWTVVDLLRRQFPRLLAASSSSAAHLSPSELAGLEGPVPEQLVDRYPTPPDGRILVDAGWKRLVNKAGGTLHVGFDTNPTSGNRILGVVTRVYAGTDDAIASLPGALLDVGVWPVAGTWIRLTTAPPVTTAEDIFEAVEALLPPLDLRLARAADEPPIDSGFGPLVGRPRLRRDLLLGRVEIIGLLFPDETQWRRRDGWSWLFVLRTRADRRHRWQTRLVRAASAGRADLTARAPAATRLADKRVLIVGLGSIGSRVADGLARAGAGRLTLLDEDTVEPGNLTRHAATFATIGMSKVFATAHTVRNNSPLTRIDGWALHIGGVHLDSGPDTHQILLHAIDDADLCVDATADPAVNRYLAAHTAAAHTPYLNVSATGGAWGGVIAHIRPGRTEGCWSCLMHHRADHSVPFPPANPDGYQLQPPRCSEPTFTGAAADLDTIAVHAVRIITHHLSRRDGLGHRNSLSELDADLHIATLRDAHGRPCAARWTTVPLAVHPRCPLHAAPEQQAP